MKSIAFILPDYSSSQLAYAAVRAGNELIQRGWSVCGFFERISSPCVEPLFSLMEPDQISGWSGAAIAFTQSTARLLAQAHSPRAKFFCVWDLEWMRGNPAPFEFTLSIYRSMPLLARSHDHARLISSCWNVPVVGIVDNLDVDKLEKIAQ